MPKEKFPGVFLIKGKLATINSVPGFRPFGERTFTEDDKEYRMWDPNRSKAGAAIMKGIKKFPIHHRTKVLYLGIAHGFTASYLSNIIGEEGIIYGVEFSDRCFRELVPVTEKYDNIVPIMADARFPDRYGVSEKVDVVFVDIAQPDLTDIAIRNCKEFLKEDGYLMLAVKTQSIDVTKSSKKVTDEQLKKLIQHGFEIIDWKMLDPFEAKHSFIVARY